MSLVLVFRSPAGEQTVALEDAVVVGRDASCDIIIDSVRLSRRHAEFSPTPRGVEVRDLESRNGILLNGERVDSALLTPAGKLIMGDVSVTVRDQAAGSPMPPPIQTPIGVDSERTTLLSPLADDGPSVSAPAAGDRTTLLPAGGGFADSAPIAPPPAAARTGSAAATSTPAASSATSRLRGMLGFTGRAAALMLVVSLSVFLLAVVPLRLQQGQVLEAAAEARAGDLARLLASENLRVLAAGARLSATLGPVADVGGVRRALVIGPDGRVLAPTEQLDEVVTELEGFGDVRQIRGLQHARSNGMFEAAIGIDDGARRLGVAWVRFDPVQAAGGRVAGAGVLFTSLVLGLVVALAGALLLRRMVSSRLEAFTVDVDLALGNTDVLVGDHASLPGLSKVAETIDYMLQRLRSRDSPSAPAEPRPVPVPAPRAPRATRPSASASGGQAAPGRAAQEPEGRLVLDSGFVVREADARGLELVGSPGTSIAGKHVLEAIPDQLLVTGIIDCIGGLDRGSDATQAFDTPVGGGVREIVASRTDDGLIRLSLRGS